MLYILTAFKLECKQGGVCVDYLYIKSLTLKILTFAVTLMSAHMKFMTHTHTICLWHK